MTSHSLHLTALAIAYRDRERRCSPPAPRHSRRDTQAQARALARLQEATERALRLETRGLTQYVKEIVLPWPDAKLTPHAKGHWRPKAQATKDARNLAWAKAMERPPVQTIPDAVIFVEYWPKARRGRRPQHGTGE